MNSDRIADNIIDKLTEDGYYCEMDVEDLKKTLSEYIQNSYDIKLTKESNKLENKKKQTGSAPSSLEYEKSYKEVENHMLYISNEVAASCEDDLDYLKNFI